MVFLNEWLPNPVGADAAGEWVEFLNGSDTPVDLSGWVLKNESGKTAPLGGRVIPAHGLLVLRRVETKLALRNTDGGLILYTASGTVADREQFAGIAPEGKSFSRVRSGAGTGEGAALFAFVDPTPGAVNKTETATLAVREYPKGIPLAGRFEIVDFSGIMVGTALCIALIFLYAVKTNEDLSKLFFRSDPGRR